MSTAQVLTSSEARSALPRLGEEIERVGLAFEPVYFGSHRKRVGAIVPAALLEEIESLLEDMAIARQVTARLAKVPGGKTMAEFATEVGLDPVDFE